MAALLRHLVLRGCALRPAATPAWPTTKCLLRRSQAALFSQVAEPAQGSTSQPSRGHAPSRDVGRGASTRLHCRARAAPRRWPASRAARAGIWFVYLLVYGALPLWISGNIYSLLARAVAPMPAFWLIIALVPAACVLPTFLLRSVARRAATCRWARLQIVQEIACVRVHACMQGRYEENFDRLRATVQ